MAKSDLDLNFCLLEVGTNGKVEIVPEVEKLEDLPFTTLPIGLPPILPDLKEELEQRFVTCPEKLPIHDLERVQQLWPREPDVSSLYHGELHPLQTTIVVDRNPTTGELRGYKEAFVEDGGISAKNSLSLKRQPGPIAETLRGNSTNKPFWPGGLEEPNFESLRSGEELEQINLEQDLEDIPPGFMRGVQYEKKSVDKVLKPRVAGGVIDIRDIIADDDEILFENTEGDNVEESQENQDKNKEVENNSSLPSEEQFDAIIELSHRSEDLLDSGQTRPQPGGGGPSGEEFAVKVDINTPVDDFYKRIPDMAYSWPFELDVFQKQAILHLENHDNVFVAAHTSAGKTVVAEYAIALSMKHCTRTIYTSPIKALSNQKFRDFKVTFVDVGLVTGDVQLNQEASCLIMTTEILRSMLYNGSDVIRDLEWVIFDEVHYINDADRGVVWEEVLIMLPQHVNIILLSATVPNTLEFADWIGRTKKRKVYVVSTTKRPVPLEHFLYTGNSNKTSSEMFLIVDAGKNFLTQGYNKATDAKKERASKSSQSYGAKGHRGGNPQQDKNVWLSVIEMLKKKERLPVVAFTFSKKKIEENANNLGSVDLTTQSEKSEVHIFFQKCISRLKGSDKELPQVVHMQHLLKRGIGLHHSGILPILKEVVEMLFQKGLVKVLFATETFAMGVNMPARTVVFDSTRKHDGTNFRDLLPGEYIQMAGRAGRRGLDTVGTVIILCKGDVPEMADLHKMMLGKPTHLQSQFRLTYCMILNLLRVEQLRVEDMMKRSFSEFHNQKDISKKKESLHELAEKVEGIEDVIDYTGDLEDYYHACEEYWSLKHDLQGVVLTHPQAIKSLSAGRVIVVDTAKHKNSLAVVLQGSPSGSKERSYTVLVICETKLQSHLQQEVTNPPSCNSSNNLKHDSAENCEDCDWVFPRPVIATQLFRPEGPCGQEVVKIKAEDISAITVKTLKISADRIVDDVKKRQMPRFRNDPPGQSTVTATQELLRLVESNPAGFPSLDPMRDLHMRDVDMVESFRRLTFLEEGFPNFRCVHDPCFLDNFAKLRRNTKLREELRHLTYLMSDESLQLLPEYQQRIEVLRKLKYIDIHNAIQLKGRVACEISSHELIITELVFENVLTSLHPAEIAALLSCVVFEQKNCSEPNLNPDLLKAKEDFLIIAEKIGNVQKDCHLKIPVHQYVEQFNFSLLEVVFEWARGMPFSEITDLTDIQEGIIVRCIQRLDEVLKDVRNAARIIGDPVLYQKMEESSSMIKRDIVFAASLYTQ